MYGTCQILTKLHSERQSARMYENYCPAIEKLQGDKIYVEKIGPEQKAHKSRGGGETICGRPLGQFMAVPSNHLHAKCRECFRMGGIR